MLTLTDVRVNARTRAAITTNLIHYGNLLTTEEVAAGIGWYKMAARTARRLARRYGTTFHRAAGTIAAFSPRQRWSTNVAMAERALAGDPRGLPLCVGWYERIAAGERPTSVLPFGNNQKVSWFYRAIAGDPNAVVIDRWCFRAAIGIPDAAEADMKNLERVGVYGMVLEAYREVAPMFGLTPREFQAAVWVHIRGEVE